MISDGDQNFIIWSTGSISRSKYRSKDHHPKIYPNHKNDVRLEFLAFSPFQRYLTFPDGTTSSKDMVFWSCAPPLFCWNFQKINPPYLGNHTSNHWKILDLKFRDWNQHVCQISLNSERVGFRIVFFLGDLTWNYPLKKYGNLKL